MRIVRCHESRFALRYTNYLDFVYAFWGPIALQRLIRLSDFTKRAKNETLSERTLQICFALSRSECSGRRVIVFLGGISLQNNPFDNNIARVSTAQRHSVRGSQNLILCSLYGEREREREIERKLIRHGSCTAPINTNDDTKGLNG